MKSDGLYSADVSVDGSQYFYRKTSLAVVGEAIVLSNQYDEDQTWFPFAKGYVLLRQHRGPPFNFTIFWNDGQDTVYDIGLIEHMARNPETYTIFLPDEEGIPQYLLPFPEHRRQRREEIGNLFRTDFASFERDADGDILRFPYPAAQREDLELWLDENCQGRYLIEWDAIYLERREDAVPLLLRL